MQAITTVGLDIAKSVFQVHGVDAAGNVVVRRQLRLEPQAQAGSKKAADLMRQINEQKHTLAPLLTTNRRTPPANPLGERFPRLRGRELRAHVDDPVVPSQRIE
jgi:hypothetical protein